MGRIVGRLITLACLAGLAAGCVALPALDLSLNHEANSSRRQADDDGAAESLTESGDAAAAPTRLGMRNLAAVLDTLARMESTRPEWKPELLRELSQSDAASVQSIVDKWRQRLDEIKPRSREPQPPAEPPANQAIDNKPRAGGVAGDVADVYSDSASAHAPPQSPFQPSFERIFGGATSRSRPLPPDTSPEFASRPTDDITAADVVEPPTWDELMRALATRARERAGGPEPDAALARVQAALLSLVWQSAQSERATAAPDPELWRQLAPAVELSLGSTSSPRKPQEIIESLQVATELLRGPGRFQVRGLAFCRRIRGYDNIERLESAAFAASQPVLLYSEVDHFFSEPVDAGFNTKLSSTLELIGPGGQSAWRQEFAAVEDMSDAPRRDFFMSHSFRLPANLRPGRYSLRLALHDELANRTATSAIALTVR